MQIRVLFFGVLKELMGRGSEAVNLPNSATVGDLLAHYEKLIPGLKPVTASIAMSVNQEYAGAEAKLNEGDEVALLPPVSGGAEAVSSTQPQSQHAAMVREPIETEAQLRRIKQPQDGAVAVFEGIARNNTRGRRTLHLDYEAYEDMALKQMEQLAQQALTRFSIRDLAIVHRLGRLEIGETSVLILVASAHRAAAFDACRWLIDMLKRTVPIWKKEYFEDGAVWAEGESFPSEIVRGKGTHSAERASK
jgi:MoaE-MoaD fusion protein